MRSVWEDFRSDIDVAVLYAESLMNLKPWALWDIKTGEPAEGARTLEIKRVLDKGLQNKSDHPGLLHLYIHLMEMSPTPEKALLHAELLRELVPDSGHLCHMPAHIDILCGNYHQAIGSNHKAILADNHFFGDEGSNPSNASLSAATTENLFYSLYRCHNVHFLLYAAMLSGNSHWASKMADLFERVVPDALLRVKTPPMADWLEAFRAMKVHALVRFGRWEELLALPQPEDKRLFCFTEAMILYGKCIASSTLGMLDQARDFRTRYHDAKQRVAKSRNLFNNTCQDM